MTGGLRASPRVTLVNTNLIQPPVAPIAFDYLYEPLVEAGFEPRLLDLCFAPSWEAAIEAHQAEVAPAFWGLTLRNTEDTYFASQQSFLALVRSMIQVIRRVSTSPIILGGVGFSVMPARLLVWLGADFGIVREGEVAFPALLSRLARGEPPDDLPGLVFRTAEGVRTNPPASLDLTTVPPHRRMFVDNPRYFRTGGMVAVETKRGCNRACVYCVDPVTKGRQVRPRAIAQVVDEMESLLARGMNVFHVNDSEFNLDLDHAGSFCQEILRRGLSSRLQWYAYGMPHPFPEEFARLMVSAGCAGMNFGVDSTTNGILRVIRRSFRRDHVAATVDVCRRAGLPYMLEILLGFPGETADTVRSTIGFLKEVSAALVSITAGIRVFPGTEMEARVRAEGLSPDNRNLHGHVADNDALVQPVFYLSAQIAPDPLTFIAQLIAGDARFFPLNAPYMNYNANAALTEAIQQGARGAYWHILDQLRRSEPAQRRDPIAAPGGA